MYCIVVISLDGSINVITKPFPENMLETMEAVVFIGQIGKQVTEGAIATIIEEAE